jgi:hypothetical protein
LGVSADKEVRTSALPPPVSGDLLDFVVLLLDGKNQALVNLLQQLCFNE